MEDSASDVSNQNISLRNKFLSVLTPVISSGDEENIITLLTSIYNICQSDGNLLIPLECHQNLEENKEKIDFICWFIGELMMLESSRKVHETNIQVHMTIFQQIALKNCALFPIIFTDYLEIGMETMEVLKCNIPRMHQCFKSSPAVGNLKPRELELKNLSQLEYLATTISDVIRQLADYILLYSKTLLKNTFLFLGRMLEIGSYTLKKYSLDALANLIRVCGISESIEQQDYIIQLIGSCTLFIAKEATKNEEMSEDLPNDKKISINNLPRASKKNNESKIKNLSVKSKSLSENKNTSNSSSMLNSCILNLANNLNCNLENLEKSLCNVILNLRFQLPDIFNFVLHKIAATLNKFLHNSHKFIKLKSNLLKELLLLVIELIHSDKLHDQQLLPALQSATLKNMQTSQFIQVCLKELIFRDLESIFSVEKNKKRSHFQSENECLNLDCWNVSLWWNLVVENLKVLIQEISTISHTENVSIILCHKLKIVLDYLNLGCEIIAKYSCFRSVTICYIPADILTSFLDAILNVLKLHQIEPDVLLLIFKTIHAFVFILVASRCHLNEACVNFLHNCTALSSTKWLETEVNWKDLKCSRKNEILDLVLMYDFLNADKFTSNKINSDIPDNKDSEMMTEEEEFSETKIGILCLIPHSVAPSWRFDVMRNLLSDSLCLSELALWMPVFMSQMVSTSSSKQIFESFLNKIFSNQEENVQKNFFVTLKHLFCAALGHARISPRSNKPCSFDCLSCSVCDSNHDALSNVKNVDINLVQSTLSLLCNAKNHEIVLTGLHILPILSAHSLAPFSVVEKCLEFLFTEKIVIRTKFVDVFVKCLKINTSKFKESKHNPFEMQFLDFLGDKIDETVSETYFRSYKSILSILEHFLDEIIYENQIINLILPFVISTDREVFAFSYIFISEWCKRLKIKPRELYSRNRKNICNGTCKYMNSDVGISLSQISEAFKWGLGKESKSYVLFGNQQLRYLLPGLVVRSAKEGKPNLLIELVNCFNLRLRDTLIDHFQFIIPHLVFYSSKEEKMEVLSYISDTTNIPIDNIRKCSLQHQVNELILGFYSHRKAVLEEFVEMAQLESETRSNLQLNDLDKLKLIGDFIAPRLLGILGYLDGKLLSLSTSLNDKQEILLSLSSVIQLLNVEQVSPVARKILATLKAALFLNQKTINAAICKTWSSFLSRLDFITLESIIEEIVVICMPLFSDFSKELGPIFQTILLENENMKELLSNLPIFPTLPPFEELNYAIRKAQNYMDKSNKESVVKNLTSIRRSLNHESQELRLHTLQRLKSTLLKNQDFIQDLVFESEKTHEIVSDIFINLLNQCRDSEVLHLLVAECIGLFGAIDPARLRINFNQKQLSEVFLTIQTTEFVIFIIQELSRSFLSAADSPTQTCASYAMQELIRIYKIEPTPQNSQVTAGQKAYSKLPLNVQDMLKPLQNSKYTVGQSQKSYGNNCPIYNSKQGMSFTSWLTNWTCYLVELLPDGISKHVFTTCKPIMKRDSQVSLRLLPSLLVSVLTENQESHSKITQEVLTVIQIDAESKQSTEKYHLAVQTVFSCLDYIDRWSKEKLKREQMIKRTRSYVPISDELKHVFKFLASIPSDLLARTSFRCQAYSRALLNLESYLMKNPEKLEENLTFLQSIYVRLDEPDGVAGVAAIRREDPSLQDQIIEHESTGKLHDALGCYERLCIAKESHQAYEGMLKCYLALGQPQSVLNITEGLTHRNSDLAKDLNEYKVEAAWKLGQWDQLDELLKQDEGDVSTSWGVEVGKALLAAREKSTEKYNRAIKHLRIQQITPLSAASMEAGSYQRSYPHIVRLQILKEFDEVVYGLLKVPLLSSCPAQSEKTSGSFSTMTPLSLSTENAVDLPLHDLLNRWNQQLRLIQTSHRFLEPIINFRRTLLNLVREINEDNVEMGGKVSDELAKTYLISAKIARKAGHLQQGELVFYGAGHGRDVFMERAKWHWAKGEEPKAVSVLRRGIDKFFPNADLFRQDIREDTLPDRRICAQAKLLLAHYSEESSTMDLSAIKMYYREACEIHRNSEDGHFNLAMYYDRILNTVDFKEKPIEWLSHIVQSFGKSLNYGCKHLYQSMPRLLSIWLDYGSKVVEVQRSIKGPATVGLKEKMEEMKTKLDAMHSFIINILERLPKYMFLIALPQLISRICHSNVTVFKVLSNIIASILTNYPQQAIWLMIAVSKSSYKIRRERCVEIFNLTKKNKSNLDKFIYDTTKLCDTLVELSDKHVEKGITTMNINTLMRTLPRLLTEPGFSKIMLPIQSQMNLTLPDSYTKTGSTNLQALTQHDPFPREYIYIVGIEEDVEIMQSLVKPKKITLRCSDGKKYIMMCKPKDDMRKDCRLMEFNSFINRLLRKDPECRKRDLKIRTYMVVPLNEECGLIEWVPNLTGLRHILHKLYKDIGKYTSGHELKRLACSLEDSLARKVEVFTKELIPLHPPILYKWFLETFVDTQAWCRARMMYCRTTAVMSMVGYILGLGDRHGENILLDSESGDIIHVDFNCLFNKGETFDWPEKIPFRLTNNMVKAMGPTGYEGIFRKTCEVTMKVMRKETDELMSVLKPFLYDPLVEWEKDNRKNKQTADGNGEIVNVKAQYSVNDIEKRISGQIRSIRGGIHLPLSVEGQVNTLIEEATSIENLSQMYIGWAAYL